MGLFKYYKRNDTKVRDGDRPNNNLSFCRYGACLRRPLEGFGKCWDHLDGKYFDRVDRRWWSRLKAIEIPKLRKQTPRDFYREPPELGSWM